MPWAFDSPQASTALEAYCRLPPRIRFFRTSPVYQNSGNSISVLNPTNPNTAILQLFNGQGLYAVSF